MRHDLLDQLSNRQVFTATAVSTNSKRKKLLSQDLAMSSRFGLVVAQDEVAAVGGAATFEIQAIQADNGALTTNVEVLSSSGPLTVAQLNSAAGQQMFVPVMPGRMTKEYYGARVVVTGGTTPSATLNIYVGVVDDVATYRSFATPYNVQN